MSDISSESDDTTRMMPKDQTESLSANEGNSGVSFSGGRGTGSLKKGPWTSAEDAILIEYVKKHGEGNWNAVQKHSGLFRCGKSCRLRWANHLRPNLKKGAFTPEEEQLIIELHARMGNKWARMAAHLPGRTDNEIKNYWNTRIKRCQRAGLPLYPPNICFQSWDENGIQSINELVSDNRCNGHVQPNSYNIPEVMFDNFKADRGLSCLPLLPDIPLGSMVNEEMELQFMPPMLDRFKDSGMLFPGSHCNSASSLPTTEQFSPTERFHWPLGIGFPHDPDPGSRTVAPADMVSGSHTLENGNLSTSQTIPVSAKLELPSLQYPETDVGSWLTSPSTPPPETFVESSLTVSVQSDDGSPRNSGLLEALLHEARAKNKTLKNMNATTILPSDSDQSLALNFNYNGGDCSHPWSPLNCSTASASGACTPTARSSWDEASTGNGLIGLVVKPEPVEHTPIQYFWGADTSPQLDFSRPDELCGSGWYSNDSKNQTFFGDATTNVLGEGLRSECQFVPAGPPSLLTQGLGTIKACPWSFMPPVCQMSELP